MHSGILTDKGTLGVHQVELVVDTGQGLSNGSSVGNHANSALDTSQITSRNDSGWLVVDSAFEASWTPITAMNRYFVSGR